MVNKVVVTVFIDASPEKVFAVIANPQKPFLTSNSYTRMEVIGEQTCGAGTRYRWLFTLPVGLHFQFDEVVTEWIEPEQFSYRAISGWVMEATNQLMPAGQGTHITFSLSFNASGIWGWLIPRWLVRLGTQKSLHNLKRSLEHPGRS